MPICAMAIGLAWPWKRSTGGLQSATARPPISCILYRSWPLAAASSPVALEWIIRGFQQRGCAGAMKPPLSSHEETDARKLGSRNASVPFSCE